MSLNAVASMLCAAMAACLFLLFVVSSPNKRRWMNLPLYVRAGICSTATVLVWCAAVFTQVQPGQPGIVNPEWVLVLVIALYTVAALTFEIARRHLPDGAMWDRIRYVEEAERMNPGLVPVMKDQATVVDDLREVGFMAVSPGAAPHELFDPPRQTH